MSELTPVELERFEAIARRADKTVQSTWRYTPDPPIDKWNDYSDFFLMPFDKALEKHPWAKGKVVGGAVGRSMFISDDCDALAMTSLSLAYRNGVPLNLLFLAAVFSDENQDGKIRQKNADDLNHAIGLVKLGPRWLVIGDTFATAYILGNAPFRHEHVPVAYGAFTDPTNLKRWPK